MGPNVPKFDTQVIARHDVVGEGREELCERQRIDELGEGVFLLAETDLEA